MRWFLILILAGGVMAEDKLPDFDKLWSLHKPELVEEAMRKVLPNAEATGNADYILQLKTQIARTLGLQGKFDEAHALLDEVEKGLTEELEVVRIRYLLERGRCLNSSGSPDKARPLFLEAWEFGVKHRIDGYAVDAAHMMAYIAPLEEQDPWNVKAMELAEKSDDEKAKRWLGTLYNNMGWTAHDKKDYKRALELLKKCQAFHENRNPTSRGTRIAKYSVGVMLRKNERLDEALKVQQALVDSEEEPDGFVYEEMGECLLALGKEEEAKTWFEKAYPLLSKIKWVADDKKRIDRLKQLAGFQD